MQYTIVHSAFKKNSKGQRGECYNTFTVAKCNTLAETREQIKYIARLARESKSYRCVRVTGVNTMITAYGDENIYVWHVIQF